jgi:hypothetical protein
MRLAMQVSKSDSSLDCCCATSQALQCLVSIQRSLVDWYQITTANAALGVLAAAAAADAEADDQHLLEADPKPAAAGASHASLLTQCRAYARASLGGLRLRP